MFDPAYEDGAIHEVSPNSYQIMDTDRLDAIFYKCDIENNGFIPVSRLVKYLRENVSFLEPSRELERLKTLFDPEGVDRSVDLETFRSVVIEFRDEGTDNTCYLTEEDKDAYSTRWNSRPSTVFGMPQENFSSNNSSKLSSYPNTSVNYVSKDERINQTIESTGMASGDKHRLVDEEIDYGELICQVETLQFNNRKLSDEKLELRAQLLSADDTAHLLTQQIEQLRNDAKIHKVTSDRLCELKDENESLKTDLINLNQLNGELKQKMKHLEREKNSLENGRITLEEKIDGLICELEASQKSKNEIHKSLNERNCLLSKNEKIKIAQENQLLEESSKVTYLNSEIKELNKVNDTLRQERNDLEIQLNENQHELTSLRLKCENIKLNTSDDFEDINIVQEEELMPVTGIIAPSSSSTPCDENKFSLCSEIVNKLQAEPSLPSPLCDKEQEDVLDFDFDEELGCLSLHTDNLDKWNKGQLPKEFLIKNHKAIKRRSSLTRTESQSPVMLGQHIGKPPDGASASRKDQLKKMYDEIAQLSNENLMAYKKIVKMKKDLKNEKDKCLNLEKEHAKAVEEKKKKEEEMIELEQQLATAKAEHEAAKKTITDLQSTSTDLQAVAPYNNRAGNEKDLQRLLYQFVQESQSSNPCEDYGDHLQLGDLRSRTNLKDFLTLVCQYPNNSDEMNLTNISLSLPTFDDENNIPATSSFRDSFFKDFPHQSLVTVKNEPFLDNFFQNQANLTRIDSTSCPNIDIDCDEDKNSTVAQFRANRSKKPYNMLLRGKNRSKCYLTSRSIDIPRKYILQKKANGLLNKHYSLDPRFSGLNNKHGASELYDKSRDWNSNEVSRQRSMSFKQAIERGPSGDSGVSVPSQDAYKSTSHLDLCTAKDEDLLPHEEDLRKVSLFCRAAALSDRFPAKFKNTPCFQNIDLSIDGFIDDSSHVKHLYNSCDELYAAESKSPTGDAVFTIRDSDGCEKATLSPLPGSILERKLLAASELTSDESQQNNMSKNLTVPVAPPRRSRLQRSQKVKNVESPVNKAFVVSHFQHQKPSPATRHKNVIAQDKSLCHGNSEYDDTRKEENRAAVLPSYQEIQQWRNRDVQNLSESDFTLENFYKSLSPLSPPPYLKQFNERNKLQIAEVNNRIEVEIKNEVNEWVPVTNPDFNFTRHLMKSEQRPDSNCERKDFKELLSNFKMKNLELIETDKCKTDNVHYTDDANGLIRDNKCDVMNECDERAIAYCTTPDYRSNKLVLAAENSVNIDSTQEHSSKALRLKRSLKREKSIYLSDDKAENTAAGVDMSHDSHQALNINTDNIRAAAHQSNQKLIKTAEAKDQHKDNTKQPGIDVQLDNNEITNEQSVIMPERKEEIPDDKYDSLGLNSNNSNIAKQVKRLPTVKVNGRESGDTLLAGDSKTQDVKSKTSFSACPSLGEKVLSSWGLKRSQGESLIGADKMSEKEIEESCNTIILGFKTDKETLESRVEKVQRFRDTAEANVKKEIQEIKDSLQMLESFCYEEQSREYIMRIKEHVRVLESSSARAMSRSESLGASRLEYKLSRAIHVMVKYVENLKRKHEVDYEELKMSKKILEEYNMLNDSGGSKVSYGSTATGPQGTRRRASVAVVRGLQGQQLHKLTNTQDPKSFFKYNSRNPLNIRRSSFGVIPSNIQDTVNKTKIDSNFSTYRTDYERFNSLSSTSSDSPASLPSSSLVSSPQSPASTLSPYPEDNNNYTHSTTQCKQNDCKANAIVQNIHKLSISDVDEENTSSKQLDAEEFRSPSSSVSLGDAPLSKVSRRSTLKSDGRGPRVSFALSSVIEEDHGSSESCDENEFREELKENRNGFHNCAYEDNSLSRKIQLMSLLKDVRLRYTVAGIIFLLGSMCVLMTCIPSTKAAESGSRYQWSSLEELLWPFMSYKHVAAPPH